VEETLAAILFSTTTVTAAMVASDDERLKRREGEDGVGASRTDRAAFLVRTDGECLNLVYRCARTKRGEKGRGRRLDIDGCKKVKSRQSDRREACKIQGPRK
jgi:hypothetical protein